MPDLKFNAKRKRWEINKRVPAAVRRIIGGPVFRDHKFPQSMDRDAAEAMRNRMVEQWKAEWAATVNASRPPISAYVPAQGRWTHGFGGRVCQLPADTPIIEQSDGYVLDRDALTAGQIVRDINGNMVALGQSRGIAFANGRVVPTEVVPKLADATEVVPWESMIEPWKKWRKSMGKVTPAKAESAMRRVMTRLFKFLGHDDMGRVTKADITRHSEDELLSDAPKFGKRLAAGGYRDHVINLQSLFSLAHERDRITNDPTIGLTYQKKTGSRGRLTDDERFAIYEAACRETDPLYKWAILFGLLHGVGPAEICEADTRDLVVVDGVPVFMIQPDHREGDEKILKSVARKRGLPIHSAFRDEFVRHVRSLPPGPLFKGLKPYQGRRAKDASNRLNDWLRDVAGIAKGKSFYWMRHTVKSTYEAAWLPDRLNDYLLGHSVQAVAAVYLHREIKELIRAVELVTVPERPMEIAA